MVALPADRDVGGRGLLPGRDGIDGLDERLDVSLVRLAAPLLIATVRLLIVLRDERRRTGQHGDCNGQRNNPTNLHHASPERETPGQGHPRI